MQKGILHLSHSPTIGLTGFLQALPPSIIAVHLGLAILLFSGVRRGKRRRWARSVRSSVYARDVSNTWKMCKLEVGREIVRECEDGESLLG